MKAKEIDGANQGQEQLSDTEPIRCSGAQRSHLFRAQILLQIDFFHRS
jgi:hypothetical protein